MNASIPAGRNDPLAYQMPAMETKNLLEVSSPAFADSESIPLKYSAYGDNVSLPLAWGAGPNGTRSYVLVMEDPDAPTKPLPVVHWLVWNIPAAVRHLDEHLPTTGKLASPAGAHQGKNAKGKTGYLGPKPPEGNPSHHYNVQIFALDGLLDLPEGSDRHQLLMACEGHVLAAGVLVGKFAWPVE